MSEVVFRTLAYFLFSHAYLFGRGLLSCRRKRRFLLALPWFVCMGLFPLVYRLLPDDGTAQRLFGLAVEFWQPVAFFALLVCIPFDLLRLVGWVGGRLSPSFGFRPRLSSRPALLFFALFACLYGYGLYEARGLRVSRLEIPVPDLPVERVRVVFAADLHIGPQTGRAMLRRTVDAILAQNADAILLGGDMFDDSRQGTPEDRACLARLAAPLGVYGVLGNHDAFGDHRRPEALLREAGIHMLCDEAIGAGPLWIAGLTDPDVRAQKNLPEPDPAALLRRDGAPRAALLLAHRPTVFPQTFGAAAVQLSGHTHGGQIFLLEPLMRAEYNTPTGAAEHRSPAGATTVFTSTGVGFSKLPIRWLRPPEIVVVDLIRQEPSRSATGRP